MRRHDRVAGAASAALVLMLAAGCGTARHASGSQAPGPGHSPASTPASGRAGAPASESTPPQLPGFEAAGASFIDPDEGWVLGRTGCADCAGLLMTKDGGSHWSKLPSPPAPIGYDTQSPRAVTNVAFAGARDGFLYGPAMLTTRDGGRSWTRDPLPPVQSFAMGAGFAYAVTQPDSNAPYTLWRTAAGSGRWTRLPLPAAASAPVTWNGSDVLAVYAEGATVVLLRRGFTGPVTEPGLEGQLWLGADGTNWQSRTVPCTVPTGGGAAVLGIARAHPGAWLLDCYNNEQSQQQQNTQHHLFGTIDGGLTWVRLPDPAVHDAPLLLADNGSGHAFLAEVGGRDELRATFDGGMRWQTILVSGGSFYGWADLTFLNAGTGFVVGATHYGPEHVYRTDDGGRTWRVLPV